MTKQKWIAGCVAVFFVLNGWGLWRALSLWEAHLKGSYPEPALVQSPEDDQVLGTREALSWGWDLPVVADAVIGSTLDTPPVTFEPDMSGLFTWVNDRTLHFVPAENWPVARRVHVDMDTVVTNRQGRVQALKDSRTVVGPPLGVKSLGTSIRWDQRQLQIRLQFNAPVNLEDLRSCLVLMNDQGESVEPELQTTPQPDEFLVHAHWDGVKQMQLILREGLPSIHGRDGALASESVYTIHAPERFAFQGREVEQPTFGPGHLDLSFSSRPDLQSLQDGLTIEPSVKFSLGKGRWWRDNQCRVTGDFNPGTRYTVTLGTGVQGTAGHPLREPVSMEVIFPEREPGLEFAHEGWVLNAAGAKQIAVNTENEGALDLSLSRVHDNNRVALAVRQSGKDGYPSRRSPDNTLSVRVWESKVVVPESGVVPLDLSEPLEELGQGVYRLQVRGRTSRKAVDRLLVVSDIGLLARRHGDEMMVWAVRLLDGQPAEALNVTLWSDTRQELGRGVTGADGVVRIDLSPDPDLGNPLVVLAQGGDSLGILNLTRALPYEGPNGQRPYLMEGHEAYVYSSRGIYRPEETVHARAMVRGHGFSLPGEFPAEWTLFNPAGQQVWHQQVTLSDVGTTDIEIDLQSEWPNGRYRLELGLPGGDVTRWGSTTFALESFVPPQVVVEAETPGHAEFAPDAFEVAVIARMLYGGPAALHEGKAILTLTPEDFRSSEYPDHHFSDDRKDGFGTWTRPVGTFKTDAEGQASVQVRIPSDKHGPSAMRAVVGVSVQEFSGRAATGFVSRRIDRVPYYLGIQSGVHDERRVMLDVVGVAPGGGRISESPEVEVEWYRVNWSSGYRRDRNGRYTYVSEEVRVSEGRRKLTLHRGHADFVLPLEADGVYLIAVEDPEAGTSTTARVRVGRTGQAPERADRVSLTPDRETYQPGEIAVLDVEAPFDGRALITVEGDRLLHRELVDIRERKGEVRLVVPDEPLANLWVRAVLIRPQPDDGAAPVLRAHGVVPLRLDTAGLEAKLVLTVPEELEPASEVQMVLTGTPGAEVVVAGVDEGILLLTGFTTPEPAAWLRALRRMLSLTWDDFDDLLPELGTSPFAGDVRMGGGGMAMMGRRLNPIDAKRFEPLTWWSGAQRIPEDGTLRLTMRMPEFTGEVRWMAVQVGPEAAASAEAHSKVARPVVVQQSLPLFLAPGDVTDWTVRIHNRSDRAQTVRLMPRLTGPVILEAGPLELQLNPGEVRIHRWRVEAGPDIGTAECRLDIRTDTGNWSDRIEFAVRPVEAFRVQARMRVVPPGGTLELTPADAYLDGTLKRSLQVSALPALQLEGAVQYLLRYPYGCVEQTVSAAAPALYMPEWAEASRAGSDDIVEAGIQALWRKQRPDGSFGYWSRRSGVSVSGTFLALDYLLEAQERDFEVHEASLKAGIDWTRRWLAGRNWDLDSPSANHEITMACRVLAKAGELDSGWAQRLRERRDDLDARSRVRAAETLVILGYRPEALQMLAGVSHGAGTSWDWWSHTATDADLLRVLLRIDPQDGRIPELMTRILEKRNRAGRWAHTYENATVLQALVAYVKVFGRETEAPRVVWADADANDRPVPADQRVNLEPDRAGQLVNKGSRAVYIEERTEGVPVEPPEIENTFTLRRFLLRMNGERVAQDEDLKSGDLFALVIEVSRLPQSMDHMVVDQRLPAGLEPLPFSAQDKPFERMTDPPEFKPAKPDHLEVRDDRVLIFPNRLNLRQHRFVVLVRAVTPGDYRFPGAFAQGMYAEEVQSRTPETRLQVVAP